MRRSETAATRKDSPALARAARCSVFGRQLLFPGTSPQDSPFFRSSRLAFSACPRAGPDPEQGAAILSKPSLVKHYFKLNLSLLYWIFIAPFRGEMFKIAPIFRQMVFIGVRAAPMVALTAFSVGVTLAMQAAHSLKELGAEIYVPDLVMVTLLREMGPVLIAVIVIGRSGSAVAAELGTMKVSEEIEALEVMAINPIQYLVVPRFLAMLIMLPALTIFGNYIGVFGGWAVCRSALDFNTAGYVMRALESATTWDLYSGMIKSWVFAWLIITISCNAGLHVEGGAEGVGQATTSAVVQSLLAMLVMNAVLTGIFFFAA
jgi:phospholipid/cholesterol/gamma-HCH transport system permease protein